MFLCLIQLIGGLTLKNGARKTNLQTKISSSRLNSSNHVVLVTFSDYYDSVVDFVRWDYLMEGNSAYRSLNPMVAYEKGLITWAKWVDLNLDPRTTRIVFRSMSPRHNRYVTNKLNHRHRNQPQIIHNTHKTRHGPTAHNCSCNSRTKKCGWPTLESDDDLGIRDLNTYTSPSISKTITP